MSDIEPQAIPPNPLDGWINSIPLVITSVDFAADPESGELNIRVTSLASFKQEMIHTEEALLPLDAELGTIRLTSARLSARVWAKLEELASN